MKQGDIRSLLFGADGRSLFVNASELAAVLDKNPYEPAWEAVSKVWRRHSRRTFDESGIALPGGWIDEMAKRHAGIGPLLRRAGETAPADLGEVLATAGFFAAKRGWTPAETRKLEDRVRKESFCAHGTVGESRAIGDLEAETGRGVALDAEYRHRELCVLADGTSVRIGGRVDGTSDGGKTVVEIKNRVAGLAYKLREYESFQLRAYLWIWGAPRGVLVERLEFADGRAVSCRHKMAWDEDAWRGTVAVPLERAAGFVRRLSTDAEFAAAFAGSRTKNALYRKALADPEDPA